MANYPDRSEAIKLLHEYTKTDSLRRHALGVEQSMRKMADKYNGDPDEWGLTGLMHDFDYEMYPTMEDHPFRGNEILIEKGYPESITKAIMGHATYTGVSRDTDMAKSLFSVDELTGFIFAVTYVRPSKSILEVNAFILDCTAVTESSGSVAVRFLAVASVTDTVSVSAVVTSKRLISSEVVAVSVTFLWGRS